MLHGKLQLFPQNGICLLHPGLLIFHHLRESASIFIAELNHIYPSTVALSSFLTSNIWSCWSHSHLFFLYKTSTRSPIVQRIHILLFILITFSYIPDNNLPQYIAADRIAKNSFFSSKISNPSLNSVSDFKQIIANWLFRAALHYVEYAYQYFINCYDSFRGRNFLLKEKLCLTQHHI